MAAPRWLHGNNYGDKLSGIAMVITSTSRDRVLQNVVIFIWEPYIIIYIYIFIYIIIHLLRTVLELELHSQADPRFIHREWQ